MQKLQRERRETMRTKIHYDERAALQVGLDALLRYNKAMYISLDEKQLEIPAINEFFKAEPNSPQEQSLAKMLIFAAKETFLTHPDIPERNRCACALRGVKEFHQVLEAAKTDYLKETGYFGAGLSAEVKYNERQKENIVFRNAAIMARTKQDIKKLPSTILRGQGARTIAGLVGGALGQLSLQSAAGSAITAAATSLGITTATVTGGVAIATGALTIAAVELVYSLIPAKVKQDAKEKACDMMKRAGAQIEKVSKKLADTPIGKTTTTLYNEYVEPVVSKGAAKIKECYTKVKEKAKSTWTKLKSFFA